MSDQAIALEYRDGDTLCRGVYYLPNSADSAPVVLLCPAWDGVGEEIRSKAERLAACGYIALVIDPHGEGRFYTDRSQLMEVLGPFLEDRAMLLRRLQAGLHAALTLPGADPERIGVIGYCFGGLCALDLARSGDTAIKAAVSLHGLLTGNGLGATPIAASVLVLHGQNDPLVPAEQVTSFMQEMTGHCEDWQFHSYGHTLHGFTRPGANNPDAGVRYSARADARSWRLMLDFLAETL